MSILAKELAKRIKKEFNIEVLPEIHRTRAGYWQRSEGAFSWFMVTKDSKDIGSQNKALDVLRAKKLSITWIDCTQACIDIEIKGVNNEKK